jgi:hypothetical protein
VVSQLNPPTNSLLHSQRGQAVARRKRKVEAARETSSADSKDKLRRVQEAKKQHKSAVATRPCFVPLDSSLIAVPRSKVDSLSEAAGAPAATTMANLIDATTAGWRKVDCRAKKKQERASHITPHQIHHTRTSQPGGARCSPRLHIWVRCCAFGILHRRLCVCQRRRGFQRFEFA